MSTSISLYVSAKQAGLLNQYFPPENERLGAYRYWVGNYESSQYPLYQGLRVYFDVYTSTDYYFILHAFVSYVVFASQCDNPDPRFEIIMGDSNIAALITNETGEYDVYIDQKFRERLTYYGIADDTFIYDVKARVHYCNLQALCRGLALDRAAHGMTHEELQMKLNDLHDTSLSGAHGVAPLPINSIHRAASKGDVTALKAYIASGANINERDEDGWTPLHNAAAWNHVDAIHHLISVGADINAGDHDLDTPLWMATEFGNVSAVDCLLASGADPNARDKHGRTSLHQAVLLHQIIIARLLLKAGADPFATDCSGVIADPDMTLTLQALNDPECAKNTRLLNTLRDHAVNHRMDHPALASIVMDTISALTQEPKVL